MVQTDEFERGYRERLGAGQTRWQPGDYDDFPMRPFLEKLSCAPFLHLGGCRALDLGCGTGQVACYLAARGAQVTGIDRAPAAIGFAQQMARRRGLAIDFVVADLQMLALPAQYYDLIVDSHFLHCIVDWAERASLLHKVRSALGVNGEFWSETMVGVPRIHRGERHYLDEDGIFWKALDGRGHPLSPVRRIHRNVTSLNQELDAAGLTVIQQEMMPPPDEYSVWLVRTRARD